MTKIDIKITPEEILIGAEKILIDAVETYLAELGCILSEPELTPEEIHRAKLILELRNNPEIPFDEMMRLIDEEENEKFEEMLKSILKRYAIFRKLKECRQSGEESSQYD